MYEYFNNIVCVPSAWIYEEAGIITFDNYKKLVIRGRLTVLQRGGNGRIALVEFDSMRADIKKAVIELLGDPYSKPILNFTDYIKPDPKAAEYFSLFKKPDGYPLDSETQLIYRTNAEIYNAITELIVKFKTNRGSKSGRFSLGEFFEKASKAIDNLPKKYKHSADGHQRTVRRNYGKYKKLGYLGVVHGGIGNANTRKVNADIERLILSLYCQDNKPYGNWVHEDYTRFVNGLIEVIDKSTGEIFNRKNFMDDKGQPILLSEATVWNYINAPHNAPVLAKYRSGALEFLSKIRPHHHRHAPGWALSKISMDDRDLPRKMHNGKRVKAYYAYDVKSGVVIGVSHSQSKDSDLFINCMRNMFRTVDNLGFGTPMEVEVEHHLVNNYRNDLMQAGAIFSFIRWANAGNAQEKWAETGNRLKKYGYEKRYQEGIGRFYAKLEANRTHQDKLFDSENNNYKAKTYDYEALVADDLQTIEMYNNSKHPNSKYSGMTRLEVLKYYVNPDLPLYDRALLAKYIGESTKTSIRRNQYTQVRYENYQIDSLAALDRLKPNNYEVEAYWIPSLKGGIDKVYLYQDNNFICEAIKIKKYNTARAEWTDEDSKSYQDQSKFVKQFDKMVKDRRVDISPIKIIDAGIFDNVDVVEIVNTTEQNNTSDEMSFETLLSEYDEVEQTRIARESL